MIGSEAEKLLSRELQPPEIASDMDFNDDIFNTNENKDSFNVGLHDFAKEKNSYPPPPKKPRQKQPKEPKEPKVKSHKSKKKDA